MLFIYFLIIFFFKRTHTVILIDNNDNASYIEKTIESPIDTNDIKWIDTYLNLKISDNSI
jgi:protein associated with RNAse G/E